MMNLKLNLTLLGVFFLFILQTTFTFAQNIPIIPKPQSVILQEGKFLLDKEISLVASAELTDISDYLNDRMEDRVGFRLKPNSTSTNRFTIDLNENFENEEAYKLVIDDQGINLSAKSAKGLFYGIQSFIQLLPPYHNNEVLNLPKLIIEDSPAMNWRGLLLDVSRHFFTAEEVKNVIDLMATYKLNVLHWHLVDSEGWRLEIKQYPKLTEVGGWRQEYRNSKFYNKDSTWKPEGESFRIGGYYTQEQVKDVIQYAASRQITVIPEIELPGHSGAALAAYPELSCNGNPQTVPNSTTHSGILYSSQWNFNYCAGKEMSFEFLENVFDEVIALFPAEYIHIGGDEVDMRYWEACPHCQKRMKDENLASEHELQAYFVKRIEKYLNEHGRKMIGWDEILEGGVSPSATVMSWRGIAGGIEAAKKGNNVIMSSNNPLYLNIAQTDSPDDPFAPTWSMNSLENVYNFNPIPAELTADQKTKIIGTQASLWTEFISSVEHLEFMLLPRLPAFSEVAWSGEKNKDFDDFVTRLNSWHYLNWKFTGTRFHPKHFERSIY